MRLLPDALPASLASAAARSCSRTASRALSGAAVAVLLGCSAMPMAPGTARADEAAPARFDGDLMYELMIAELAGRRGQLGVAMEGYLSASGRSDDPRVADRAARLAMFARRWPEAERAARRWIELDGEARDAREVLARALLLQGRDEEAATEYVALVALVPEEGAAGEEADADPVADGAADGEAPPLTREAVLRGLFGTLQEEPMSLRLQ